MSSSQKKSTEGNTSKIKEFQSAELNFQAEKQLENLLNLLGELQLNNPEENLINSETSSEVVQTAKEQVEQKSTPLKRNIHSLSSQHKSKAKSELNQLRQIITNLEQKLVNLEDQVEQSTEIINPLLPLIIELLRIKDEESRESVFQEIVPIIDQVIQRRVQQDCRAMSIALATVIPLAISLRIQDSPEEIAKAIAPEIARAIEEQIQLDRQAISKALAPEMGRAIKAQIELERDAMVDALYPVIGSTISKYMAEVVHSINEKVEHALSLEGIQRKIRAKIQGVSEAELIFQEAIPFLVQAVFLIHKASGLVIAEVQPSENHKLESEMLAGMLTAIRSFVNDWIARSGDVSELDQIEYGNSKILLEVAGYCYLAVIVKGEPPKTFIEKMRTTLSQIVCTYSSTIQEFNGDPATIPASFQLMLESLVEFEAKPKRTSKSPTTLLTLILVCLSAIFLPWGILQYRSSIANKIETKTATALYTTPQLSVYRLIPDVRRGTLTLTGRVPNQELRSKAEQVAKTVAPNLQLNNNIIAVDLPPDPVLAAAEVERVTSLLNKSEGVLITTNYNNGKVTIEGTAPQIADAQKISQAFEQIPGVRFVVNTLQLKPLNISTQIYFNSGSAQLKSADISGKIASVVQFLKQHPQAHLKVIGHSDTTGTVETNQKLALERARVVKKALENQGISSQRLQTIGKAKSPADITAAQPLELSRVVQFQPFIPPH